ncbi:V(D)J recombination-activating protein 1-like [Glandiceps talaboti]
MAKTLHYHVDLLRKHCRICGSKFAGTKYDCASFTSELQQCFNVYVESDEIDMHPDKFCKNCKRAIERNHSSTPVRVRKVPVCIEWRKHSRNECVVCEYYGKRGRKKKVVTTTNITQSHLGPIPHGKINEVDVTTGHAATANSIMHRVNEVCGAKYRAKEPLHQARFSGYNSTDLDCQICKETLDQPVQLLCQRNHLFCSDCLKEWLRTSPTCPLCRVTVTAISVTAIPVALKNIIQVNKQLKFLSKKKKSKKHMALRN